MRYKYNGSRELRDAELSVHERMAAFDLLPAHVREQLREAADDVNLGAAIRKDMQPEVDQRQPVRA